MSFILCKLWPYLAGGLIGWLLAGWFARRLKHAATPTERIVEKHVDNPKHLALISKLEGENKKIPSLVTQLASLQSGKTKVAISSNATAAKAVTVDNPLHLKRISELEGQVNDLSRGPSLDLKAAKAAGLSIKSDSDLTVIEGIGPKVTDLLHAGGIKNLSALSNASPSSIQKILDDGGSSYNMTNPDTWPDQANLAVNNRWPALKTLQDVLDGGVYPDKNAKANAGKSGSGSSDANAQNTKNNAAQLKKISDLEGQVADLQRGPAIDLSAAKAAGLGISSDTDFTVIEGIGPKVNDLLHAGGIKDLSALSNASPASIQKILDDGGSSYNMTNPGTWPDQASLAVNNRWPALKALQDVLDGGVYPDKNAKTRSGSSSDGAGSGSSKKAAAKKQAPELDTAAAKAAGFRLKQKNGQVDFTIIEGIGPKINDLIHADGIHTFTELSETAVDVIQKILDGAGASFRLAKPGTWPAQAEMAANNKWDALKKWQDELDGGE